MLERISFNIPFWAYQNLDFIYDFVIYFGIVVKVMYHLETFVIILWRSREPGKSSGKPTTYLLFYFT